MPAARSRLGLATKAVRPSLKARMTLAGPSGAGKTTEALTIASVLGNRTVVIDTERESALTYADEFDFDHVPWAPPYTPAELVATLNDIGRSGHDVVIVDSFSHWWNGEGGVLDIAGGKFGGWKVATPAHQAVIDAILNCPAHVILCLRSKVAYTQDEDSRTGKQRVTKLGLQAIQDSTLEYEVNLALDVEHPSHKLYVTKSRAGISVGTEYGPDQVRQFAERYRDWLAGGDDDFAPIEVRAALHQRVLTLSPSGKKSLWDRMKAHGLRDNFDTYTESQAATLDDLLGMVESGRSIEGSGETSTTGATVTTLRNQAAASTSEPENGAPAGPAADGPAETDAPTSDLPVPEGREPAPKSPVRTGVLNRLREVCEGDDAAVTALVEGHFSMPADYVTTAELRTLMEEVAAS